VKESWLVCLEVMPEMFIKNGSNSPRCHKNTDRKKGHFHATLSTTTSHVNIQVCSFIN